MVGAGLVSGEDPARPLSDETLAALLADNGPQVARRTVAKYRAMLQIAPAHRRKQRLRAATMAQGDLKRRSRE